MSDTLSAGAGAKSCFAPPSALAIRAGFRDALRAGDSRGFPRRFPIRPTEIAMRHSLAFLALALVVLPLQAEPFQQFHGPIPDKDVTEQLTRVSKLIKEARTLHVEASIVTKVTSGNEAREFTSNAVYDLRRPNYFALRTRHGGNPDGGIEVIWDSRYLYIYDKLNKEYTRENARTPEDIKRILVARQWPPIQDVKPKVISEVLLTDVHTSNSGMLFQNILDDEPDVALKDHVDFNLYEKIHAVDGVDAHRLLFRQPRAINGNPNAIMRWNLWIAANGPPVVLKAYSTYPIEGGGKSEVTETYRNWKFHEPLEEDVFQFTPPEGTNKVDRLYPGKH
jgi:hypothetical protein